MMTSSVVIVGTLVFVTVLSVLGKVLSIWVASKPLQPERR